MTPQYEYALYEDPKLARFYDLDNSLQRADYAAYLQLASSASHILDLGCGTGTLLTAIAEQYPHTTLVGADPAQAMLDIAPQWIEQLSHSRQLQEKTFSLAFDATISCEDRVAFTWNAMKKAVLLQDVEQGNYDNELPTLIKVAREMFRLEKLEKIARKQVTLQPYLDEIEVYLAYQTKLHQDLQLDSVAKDMRFFDVSNVKEDDLASATLITKTAENEQFRSWLAQWEPLHSVIKRTAPELWETTEIDLDEYQQHLDNEIDKISGKNNAGACR